MESGELPRLSVRALAPIGRRAPRSSTPQLFRVATVILIASAGIAIISRQPVERLPQPDIVAAFIQKG